MHRRDAEAQRTNELTKRVIGFAIDVHRTLGPGLLESASEKSVGLLINFNVPVLKEGLKRIVNHFPDSSASLRLCGETSDATLS